MTPCSVGKQWRCLCWTILTFATWQPTFLWSAKLCGVQLQTNTTRNLPPEVVCLMWLKTVSSSILLWSFVKVVICSITCRLAKNLVYQKALLHAWCGNCFVPSATCMGDCWHIQILRQEMSFYWRTIQMFHSSTWQRSWQKLIWINEDFWMIRGEFFEPFASKDLPLCFEAGSRLWKFTLWAVYQPIANTFRQRYVQETSQSTQIQMWPTHFPW